MAEPRYKWMLIFMENNVTPLYQYFETNSSGEMELFIFDISDVVREIMKINQESFGSVTF